MRNTKGLSTVVTTLIIILLVFVAIGIVWAVVQGIFGKAEDKIDIQSLCMGVTLSVEEATCTGTPLTCSVQVKQFGGEAINGVKIVFSNAAGSGTGIDDTTTAGQISLMKTYPSLTPGTTGAPTKVLVGAYFTQGTEKLFCSQTAEGEITA